jgi:hypothetical protein
MIGRQGYWLIDVVIARLIAQKFLAVKITGRSLGRKKKLRSDCHRVLWALVKRILALSCLAGAYAPCVVYGCTVGFTRNRDIVALVQKNVFRMYRVRTSAHSRHGLLPPTTNHKQENNGRIKRIFVLRYLIHFLPNLLFETGKSIVSICSGHPSSLFCIGGLLLQFSVRAVYG